MFATHINYKHSRHLRAVMNGRVLCVAPSHSQYARLSRGLRDYFTDHAQQERDRAEALSNPRKYGLAS